MYHTCQANGREVHSRSRIQRPPGANLLPGVSYGSVSRLRCVFEEYLLGSIHPRLRKNPCLCQDYRQQ